MHTRTLLLCATVLLGACTASDTGRASVEITGTASYRERMLVPPGSKLEVTLEDVSRADAPGEVIARAEMPVSTAPPFRFTLAFDPARVVSSHRYSVRARITASDQVLFRSHNGSPVLGPGNILTVDITMRREGAATASEVPAQQLRGMYSYMADAGWFVDCLSGVRLPVAQEGDNAKLEAAYSKARTMAGAPMLAKVLGRVENLMPIEGIQSRPTLVVEIFISIEAQGCSGPSSTAQLENTYWKLMTLNDQTVESPQGARELHLVLNSESARVNGFASCNSFSGSYELDGEKITFSRVAGTMMACAGDMSVERRIHEMLAAVTGWKIASETLQLTDANGTVLATFESRYMK